MSKNLPLLRNAYGVHVIFLQSFFLNMSWFFQICYRESFQTNICNQGVFSFWHAHFNPLWRVNTQTLWFLNLACITWKAAKMQTAELQLVSDSVGLGWTPRICISHKDSGHGDTTVARTSAEKDYTTLRNNSSLHCEAQ